MNSTAWLHHFETNRLDRPEPDWDRHCWQDPRTARKLARSLSHIQLGEDVEGSFLLAGARRTHPDDPDYIEALRLFVAEEREHARLLEHLVARFGGRLVSRHWTHAGFRILRRALGVQFETQTLIIAELIGTTYYRLLYLYTGDRVLIEVCRLVLADETAHIRFHSERLAAWQRHWPPLGRALWALQFQVILRAAMYAEWLDHRGALRAVGATRREYARRCRSECATFLHALSRPGIPAGSADSQPPESEETSLGYDRIGLPTG